VQRFRRAIAALELLAGAARASRESNGLSFRKRQGPSDYRMRTLPLHCGIAIRHIDRLGSGASNWCRSQHFRFTPTSRRKGADIVEPPVSARSCRDQKQMTWRLRAYSITSSARTKIDGGTVRPSALAVLAFTAISNFTGT
jgi:hypothetical protein